jgi:uncharacterized protein YxeA
MYYEKGKEGMLMRRKLLAAVSIVALLAMESMTVFATETGNGSPTSQDYLYGDLTTGEVITQQQGYTTEQVAETTKAVEEVKNTTVDEIIKETNVKLEVDTSTGKVTNATSGKTFEKKEETKAYQYNPVGGNPNVFNSGNEPGAKTIRNEEKYVAQEMKSEDVQKSVAMVEKMDGIGKNVNSQVQGALFADIEPKDSGDSSSSSGNDIEITDSSAEVGQDSLYAGMHIMDNNKVEYLKVTVKEKGVISLERPSSFSPIIIVKFDKPVPGVTYDIDYTTSSAATESNTIAGATSPKTAEADPYAIIIALAAVMCIIVCNKKIAEK